MLWTPREYQEISRNFIIENPRCNIWKDPGMGKTSSTATAIDILWLAGSAFHPALVIAPKRVAADVWRNDIAKWDHLAHLRVSCIVGTPAERMVAALRPADIYTVSYDNIPWLVEFFGRNWPFKLIVADEATKLKGFRTRQGGVRTRALGKIAKATGRWINLTGTPVPNGPIDLWGQCWFLDYGRRLGYTYDAFEQRWFNTFEYNTKPREGAEEEIMELIGDLTISLRAKDWFEDFIDPVPMPVYRDLPMRAQSQYDDMETSLFFELDNGVGIEASNNASKSAKCCQIANGAIYTDEEKNWETIHDTKIQMVKDIADEVSGANLMIIYWFKHDLIRLQKAFPEGRKFETEQDRLDWNAGKLSKMFVNPYSAAHGLDFQDGGYIGVFFSQTWDLEARQQVMERIGWVRQMQAGHPRPVLSYELLMRGTTDEVMYDRTFTKATVQDSMRAYRDQKRAA